MLEFRFLVSLTVQRKVPLKNGDIKQAFVQATLPPDENYVLRPSSNYKRTPASTYWLIKRTLYGLKRFLKHWFIKSTNFLQKCSLEPTQKNLSVSGNN